MSSGASSSAAPIAEGSARNITPPDSNNSSFNNNAFDNPLINPASYSPSSPQSQSHRFDGMQPLSHPHPAKSQIRPPKSPLYVPAVLRPTEKPQPKRPLTPPRSMHSSTDSLSGMKPLARPHTPSQPINIITALTRSSTASSGPSTPTGIQPTRSHWKPDAQATHCDAPGCSLAFSFLTRRHHCRRCGGIFCFNHASQQVPLNESAEISENGGWQRACDSCWSDWVTYQQDLLQRRIDGENEDGNTTPQTITAKGRNTFGKRKEDNSEAAASVPKDWSWSTF